MAKFLDTQGVSYFLGNIIKEAKEKVFLISPYLKLSDRMRELLADKDRLKLDVRIIYGKNELAPTESAQLKELRSIHLGFCKNLHAKCYLNENDAIVTSMNLYEFSQVNNNEMGILIRRSEDPELYQDIYNEVQRLIRTSEDVLVTIEKVAPKTEVTVKESVTAPPKAERVASRKREKAPVGHCIRCGESISLNPKKPYCAEDYEKWAEYENEDYKDRYCHKCGKPHPATMRRSLCKECYYSDSEEMPF